MSDLLSQDEIDALLHGVDEVEEEGAALTGDGVAQYDFSSQDRIVRGRMPTLEIVNERFARHMRISLFNMLRKTAEVSINGVQMMKPIMEIDDLLARALARRLPMACANPIAIGVTTTATALLLTISVRTDVSR